MRFVEFDDSAFTGVEFNLTVAVGTDVEAMFNALVAAVEQDPLGLVTGQRVWASTIVLDQCEYSCGTPVRKRQQRFVAMHVYVENRSVFCLLTDDVFLHVQTINTNRNHETKLNDF